MMVGLTCELLKPNDLCYIVVYTLVSAQQEMIEFLEGRAREISNRGANVPSPEHPLSRYFRNHPPLMIREIQAEVTDANANQRPPTDPIRQYQVPGRNYLVVPPQECVRYLKEERAQIERALQRTQKMNFVQQQKIESLEGALRQR